MTLKNEKVDRRKSDEAENLLKSSLAETWEDKIAYDSKTYIARSDWKRYTELLIESIAGTDGVQNKDDLKKLKKNLESMAYADSSNYRLFHCNVRKTDFESFFAYIVVVRENDRLHCSYVVHTLKFKLEATRVETSGWFIFKTRTVKENKFTVEQIEHIKETYMKHQALKQIKARGIIDEITYV